MPIHSMFIFHLIKVIAESELAQQYTISALISLFEKHECGVWGGGFVPPQKKTFN